MTELESIDDVVLVIWACRPELEGMDYQTNEQIVGDLTEIAKDPRVLAFHDSCLGLGDRLSPAFLAAHPREADQPEFEEDCAQLCEEAEIIQSCFRKPLSEDDIDDIKEDLQYRGENPDDWAGQHRG